MAIHGPVLPLKAPKFSLELYGVVLPFTLTFTKDCIFLFVVTTRNASSYLVLVVSILMSFQSGRCLLHCDTCTQSVRSTRSHELSTLKFLTNLEKKTDAMQLITVHLTTLVNSCTWVVVAIIENRQSYQNHPESHFDIQFVCYCFRHG